MLILNVILIFTTLFAMIRFENKPSFFEPYYHDLIKSIAMYARVFGHLPENEERRKTRIPFEKIGIAPAFFATANAQYSAQETLTDQSLTPFDLKLGEAAIALPPHATIIGTDSNGKKQFGVMPEHDNYWTRHSAIGTIYTINMPPDDEYTRKLDKAKRNAITYHQSSCAFALTLKQRNMGQDDKMPSKITFQIDIEYLCDLANYPTYISSLDSAVIGMPIYNMDDEHTVLLLFDRY